MNKNAVVRFIFLVVLFTTTASLSSSPDRFFRSAPTSRRAPHAPQEYLEITRPLPSDRLTPSCSHVLLRHSFADTISRPPFTAPYSPPSSCTSPPWSHVVLDLRAFSIGEQYDRISGLWIGGVELLRTSTAEPTPFGIFWNVRKDVTRYSSLFMKSGLNVTMMLENVINDVYTGIYHINVTLLFYEVSASSFSSNSGTSHKTGSILGFSGPERRYDSAADIIIPICDSGSGGFWFIVQNPTDTRSRRIQIPNNARQIVLELYASFHGNDEFWYSNPPESYIKMNNLTTGRGNGAYREVVLKIDGRYVGSEVPFPVIFTGGLNPLFWEPVVAIGAFNLPSYDIDLTPFLGLLLDGKSHEIKIQVNDAISFWLVNANLHVWLDHGFPSVEAKSMLYHSPKYHLERHEEFEQLDGSFKVLAERESRFGGWVRSSEGNLTTIVSSKLRVTSLVKYMKNGTYKWVNQRVKVKRVVEVSLETGKSVNLVVMKRTYPLTVITSTLPRFTNEYKDIYLLLTNVSHSLNERYSNGEFSSSVYNSQDAEGWMEVKDHSVLAGEASTKQSFSYRGVYGCYSRNVAANDGEIVHDSSSYSCMLSS